MAFALPVQNGIIMIIFITLALGVSAVIENYSLTLEKESMKELMWFGFQEGGKVQQNYTLFAREELELGFYLCSTQQKEKVTQDFDSKTCNKEYGGCYFKVAVPYTRDKDILNDSEFIAYLEGLEVDPYNITDKELFTYEEEFLANTTDLDPKKQLSYSSSYFFKVNKSETYYFLITNCAGSSVEVELSQVVMNPDGEHLSVGLLEMKFTMEVTKILWSAMIGIWLGCWAVLRKTSIALVQGLLMLDCLIWVIFSFVFHEFWLDYSERGVPDRTLEYWCSVLFGVAEGIFFLTVYLISVGQGVTKHNFSPFRLAFGLVILVAVPILICVVNLKSELFFYTVCGLYFSLAIVFRISISKNIEVLEEELSYIQELEVEVISTSVWYKLRIYRILRISLTILVVGLSGLAMLQVFVLEYQPWIGISSHLALVFHCHLVLFIYLRFRKVNPFFERFQQELEIENLLQEMRRNLGLHTFAHGVPFPGSKKKLFSVVNSVVLVEQPCEECLSLGIPVSSSGEELPRDSVDSRALEYVCESSFASVEDIQIEDSCN